MVFLSSFNLRGQSSDQKKNDGQNYSFEKTNEITIKETFVRNIRVTKIISDIDKHAFEHFFLDRYHSKYNVVLKSKFDTKTLLEETDLSLKMDEVLEGMVNDFNSYKNENPSILTPHKKPINMRHYDLFDLGNNLSKPGEPSYRGAGDPCNNPDFETGDGTAWDMSNGKVNGNVFEYVNPNPSGLDASHQIMTAGFDPVIPTLPVVNPDGGTYSLRLGDGTGDGRNAAGASMTFLVDENSASFTYSYALILEDPTGNPHTPGEKPFFKINAYDELGNSIFCGDYSAYGGGPDPDFQTFNGGVYLEWKTTFIPLQDYMGQNVTLEFIAGDCDLGGHYGYGYIDASCQALEIIPSDTVICRGGDVTLTAPPGAASYLWSPGGETTQSITTGTANTYSVDLIPVTGVACALTLTTSISGYTDYPIADFNITPDTITCLGSPMNFNSTSYVVGTTSIDSVKWDFESNGLIDDTTTNAVYTYPSVGNFTATLTAYNNGCVHDTTMNVVITPDAVPFFIAEAECSGTSTTFTDQSTPNGAVTIWSWDFDNDGVEDDSSQNPSYVFPNAGTFPVTLTASGNGGACASDTTIDVIVNPVPAAIFTTTEACFGSITTYTNTSSISSGTIVDWKWDFETDLTTDATIQSPTTTFGSAGLYNTQLIATSDSGCVDTVSVQVVVSAIPVANFTSDTVCDGNSTAYTDVSTIGSTAIQFWNWDFDADANIDEVTQNPSAVSASTGSFPVYLEVIDSNGCTHDTTLNAFVAVQPTAIFTFSDVCFGSATNFTDQSIAYGVVIDTW